MPCRDPYGYALTTGPRPPRPTSRGLLDVLRLRAGALPAMASADRARPHLRPRARRRSRCSGTRCAPGSTSTPGSADARLHAAPRHASASAATCTPSPRTSGATPRPCVAPPRAPTPRDALLLSVAVPTIAFAGVTEVPEEAWRDRRARRAGVRRRLVVRRAAGVRPPGAAPLRRGDGPRLHVAGRGAERRPLRARPGPRALRDRRPPRRAGLDGRLGHRRRRRDRRA